MDFCKQPHMSFLKIELLPNSFLDDPSLAVFLLLLYRLRSECFCEVTYSWLGFKLLTLEQKKHFSCSGNEILFALEAQCAFYGHPTLMMSE